MTMPQAEQKEVERSTVYLTPRNKQRLAALRRGEKTRVLNEALDRAFEENERKRAFSGFLKKVKQVKPVTPIMPTEEMLRMIREGRESEIEHLTEKS